MLIIIIIVIIYGILTRSYNFLQKDNSFYRVELVEGKKLDQELAIQFFDTFGVWIEFPKLNNSSSS